jgi:wyosine [tRNA(Phe)-imidazoG37] synthetase (radical SAM superfamily)
MSTFLFDSIIFGPVWSRRLGESLGVNLLPPSRKTCNFNCIYCECGMGTGIDTSSGFPAREEVRQLLRLRLSEMKRNDEYLNSITFAGNGEPTLHPEFPGIMDDTVQARNELYAGAKVAVLSNATLACNDNIFKALQKADLNILKLDTAIEETLLSINCPRGQLKISEMIHAMQQFRGKIIIQTLFFRGQFMGQSIDNTTEKEVNAWLKALSEIKPESVMMYSLARDTPVESLERVSAEELDVISKKVELLGIPVLVTP